MTRRWPSVLMGAVCVLVVAASASAECAWVLWEEVPASSGSWSLDMGTESAFLTKAACEKRLKARIRAFAEAPTGGARPFLRCLPDTVDPRGPKGK